MLAACPSGRPGGARTKGRMHPMRYTAVLADRNSGSRGSAHLSRRRGEEQISRNAIS